jgi:CRISPR/Cas system-associated exonuclease Cas4 (RecB family)
MKYEVNPKWRARAWSYSALAEYEECPWKYYLSRAMKLEQPKGPALAVGLAIHESAENYLELTAVDVPVPEEFILLKTEMANLKAAKPTVEEVVCLDRHWQPVIAPDPWVAPDTWLRARLDARAGDFVVDFKTGRNYPKYKEQCELYATMLYQAQPTLGDVLDFELWFTKTGAIVHYSFPKSEQRDRLDAWDARASALMSETSWVTRRNENCKWCAFQDHCPLFGEAG